MPHKRAEITNRATGSPIESDEESRIIKAYLVDDEKDDGDYANEIHSCKYCRKYLCVWMQNASCTEKWTQMKLRSVMVYIMGFTSLNVCAGVNFLE
jgi:hypothetical protein